MTGRLAFARAAYRVGFAIQPRVPLRAQRDAPRALRWVGFDLAVRRMELTALTRRALAHRVEEDSAGPGPAAQFWAGVVLPNLEREGQRMRGAVRASLESDYAPLLYVSQILKNVQSRVYRDYGPEWASAEERERIATTLAEMSETAAAASYGAEELSVGGVVDSLPSGPVGADRAALEAALYTMAMSYSRFMFALRNAARETVGAPPVPMPDEASLEADVDVPEVQTPDAPPLWAVVLASLEEGLGEIESALRPALNTVSPNYALARRLGQRWSAYDETVARLPLDTLGGAGRAEVEALAADVAAQARAVAAAADAVGTE